MLKCVEAIEAQINKCRKRVWYFVHWKSDKDREKFAQLTAEFNTCCVGLGLANVTHLTTTVTHLATTVTDVAEKLDNLGRDCELSSCPCSYIPPRVICYSSEGCEESLT